MLKPVALFPDITRKNAFLVMTEVMLPNGDPHPSNARATIPMTKVSGSALSKNTFLPKMIAPRAGNRLPKSSG